jgi:hypothetical protein
MDDAKQEIAELRAELDKVKASLAPKPFDPDEAARWQNEMHQMRERRMALASNFSPDQFAAFAAACPDETMRGIVAAGHAPTGPTGMVRTSQQQTTDVRPAPGGGTGWAREVAFGPSPHARYVDAQLDAQDRRDRHQLILEEAKRRAAEQVIVQEANRRADEPK